MPSSEYTHMRIEDKDEKGEGYLAIESKEDLEEFRKMLIEAYYELNPDRKPSRETRSLEWKQLLDIALALDSSPDEKSRDCCFDYRVTFKGYLSESIPPTWPWEPSRIRTRPTL